MFLTEAELVDLTGYRQASKQVAHLKSQRIPFYLNKANHPRVARAVLEGGGKQKPTKPQGWTPPWADAQLPT